MGFLAEPDLDALSAHSSTNLLFEAISGSRAFGLSNAQSDHDLRGVYALPPARYLSLHAAPNQINDERHDTVYYSLRRTLELLAAGNPSMIELLHSPEDCIRYRTAAWDRLYCDRLEFVSQRSVEALVGYAKTQIKKSRGQNKWINQPQPEAAPTPADHCYIIPIALEAGVGAPFRPVPLAKSGFALEHFNAARVEHGHGLFRLYHYGAAAKGVFRQGQLVCESIPVADENARFTALLLYNEQGFNRARQDHQNYWTWRRERNESRWQQQEAGQLDFDAKNMMHTLRLLYSAQTMLNDGRPLVRVEGKTQSFLLEVRHGKHPYQALQERAQQMIAECDQALGKSQLRPACSADLADRLLQECTELWEASCR